MSIYKTITVNAEPNYDVEIGTEIIENIALRIPEGVNQIAFIFPSNVQKIVKRLKKALKNTECKIVEIKVPDAESAKTLKTLDKCWNILGKNKFSRTDLIIGEIGRAHV